MKAINLFAKVAALAVVMVGISACGKKSKSNSVAAVGAGYTICTTGYNPTTGQPCAIGSQIYTGGAYGAGQNCQYNAQYGMYTIPGTMQQCQPGMNTGYGYGGSGYGGGYGYGQTGCEQANAMYPGHLYQPVQGPYGPVCQLVY